MLREREKCAVLVLSVEVDFNIPYGETVMNVEKKSLPKRIGLTTCSLLVALIITMTLVSCGGGSYGTGRPAQNAEEQAAREDFKKSQEKERERANKEAVRDILDSGMD